MAEMPLAEEFDSVGNKITTAVVRDIVSQSGLAEFVLKPHETQRHGVVSESASKIAPGVE